ncbi:PREDICTED: plant UBX domain-containing protein 2 [Nelumbo nucifera]|uniref:PUB domain-containing protein n=2 Tax=Nelumbo nucifera TaxID=4432 RepID=A0A822YDE5_NELNU|nr:PREDICTED: plant UBX domain-containing protein 2 [Nelumbo nucifera]DAD32164.1 TPA_asm: hypothetical protein HUJ06_011015 [Nelumbo nucifera]
MDDVKDKFKGFMKKVNNQFSSSSSDKFKGQGRVLGSSSSGPANPILTRPSQNGDLRQNLPPSNIKQRPSIPNTNGNSDGRLKNEPTPQSIPSSDRIPANGFDPFDSLITSGKRSQNGYSLNVVECPVCGQPYRSEEEVSTHIESCLSSSVENAQVVGELQDDGTQMESRNELAGRIGAFLSGRPSEGSVEVVLKLFRNIVQEPQNAKFRRIRMGNPKIKEAIGDVVGGVELMEYVGFALQAEGEEMWAVMEAPLEQQIFLIKEAISLLETRKTEDLPCANSTEGDSSVDSKKVDRQVRVFFSVPESIAAKINLPDSFYNLTAEELRKEADLRKKKIAESQLLIPKSYKEKQAKAARKRYKKTVIRIQFPDEVVLQGIFLPWEPTTALYEFASAALKEPTLEFELLHPVAIKRRVIPRFPEAGGRTPILDDEDLVPSALIKFKPIETDSVVFTGLCNELLEISEPLRADTAITPA